MVNIGIIYDYIILYAGCLYIVGIYDYTVGELCVWFNLCSIIKIPTISCTKQRVSFKPEPSRFPLYRGLAQEDVSYIQYS